MIFHSTLEARAEQTTALLLFGDSLVAGYGLNSEESLPVQLEKIMKQKGKSVKVINGGVSGDTTSGGRSRLKWMLKRHQPDKVILALGGNDLLRGIPPSVTRENIHAMLQDLSEAQIPAILSAVRAPDSAGAAFKQQFDGIYTQASQQFNVPLIPFFLEYTYGNKKLMQPDGIHPSGAGVEVIAEKVSEEIDLLGK